MIVAERILLLFWLLSYRYRKNIIHVFVISILHLNKHSSNKNTIIKVTLFCSDDVYKRTQLQGVEDDNTMKGLRWDGASLRKVTIFRKSV